MKPTDSQRSDLLSELFSTSEPVSVDAADVLRWVADDRKAKRRRRRNASVVASVVGAGLLFVLPSRRGAVVDQGPQKLVSKASTPAITAAPKPAAIERVDDDALLGLLDDTPAALVQWPDGRRSLLVLVKTQVPQ